MLLYTLKDVRVKLHYKLCTRNNKHPSVQSSIDKTEFIYIYSS